MQALAAYGSSDEEEEKPTGQISKKQKISAAPKVTTQDLSVAFIPGPETKSLSYNVPYKDLIKPTAGPANPFTTNSNASKNTLTGFVETHHMSDHSFNNLQRSFELNKYTVNPDCVDGTQFVGDLEKAHLMNGTMHSDITTKSKRRRKPAGSASDVNGFSGPWAGYVDEPEASDDEETPEEREIIAKAENESATRIAQPEYDYEATSSKSIFHGDQERDYLGRTYMSVPNDVDGVDFKIEPGAQECFIPKKCIHTWTGHTKAVNAIRFFPGSGHLLLSCSMDGKVKLWDVYHDRKCLRTFIGHTKGVKDIAFAGDGKTFLSCGYDKWIKLWDTESGECLAEFTTRKIPFCIKFHPNRPHIFLVGCADKKIYQFNITTKKIVQQYDQHLGAINSITFVDNARRFVSTSDDKSLRAWEFGIPVVIKYVAEPDMHSMPAVTMSHNQKWLACTSLDNKILIYSARDKFKLNRTKTFTGHLIAGYACQPNFSPDDRFVSSGDSEGWIYFWDWKSCRVLKKIKGHGGVVIGMEWNPVETSKVATCSWDGTIKYWD